MRIEELTPGTPITFMVKQGSRELLFESKIIGASPQKHLVLAEAIFRDNKVICFHGKNTGQNLIVDVLIEPSDDKPQQFKNVLVTTLKKGNIYFYSLSTLAESKPYNRRESYRCYLGLSTSVQPGVNCTAVPVVVRDVSVSGFAVVCDNALALEPNQLLHVVVNDYIKETAEQYSFQMYGLLARTQELENGKFLYGCRLNTPIPGLESYIMKKERLRLKKSNGGVYEPGRKRTP